MPLPIKALVVDDSAFILKAMKRMLRSDPHIKVVGEARDGMEAVEKVKLLKPDVVTLDVKMPRLDGIRALETIMRDCPTPVLMVSSLTNEGGALTLKALETGAVDFIDKSSCHTMMDILDIAETLIKKVKTVAGVDLDKMVRPLEKTVEGPAIATVPTGTADMARTLVAIGASTGGPMSIEKVLAGIPASFAGAVLIVQHMPVGFTTSFAERLDRQCGLSVKEAEENDPVLPGRVYVAPAGYHMTLGGSKNKNHLELIRNTVNAPHCPSVDLLLESVAASWSGQKCAVIMTGMGNDGARGAKAIKAAGGTVLAQDENTCIVYGMPKAAYIAGVVDRMAPLEKLAEEILELDDNGLTVEKLEEGAG